MALQSVISLVRLIKKMNKYYVGTQQPAGVDIGPDRRDRAARKGPRFIMTSKISMPTAMDCGKIAARQAVFYSKPKSTSLKGHGFMKPKMVGGCW